MSRLTVRRRDKTPPKRTFAIGFSEETIVSAGGPEFGRTSILLPRRPHLAHTTRGGTMVPQCPRDPDTSMRATCRQGMGCRHAIVSWPIASTCWQRFVVHDIGHRETDV
jgi:hypothetical protein